MVNRLNSTLSVRIEELNEQISTLYVENLRLRASEIALASQLKRERERSRKIITDAEAAVSVIHILLCCPGISYNSRTGPISCLLAKSLQLYCFEQTRLLGDTVACPPRNLIQP